MGISSLQPLRFSQVQGLKTVEEYQGLLNSNISRPIGSLEKESNGFFPVYPDTEDLAVVVDDLAIFCIKAQSKNVPNKIVNKYLDERVKELQAQGEKVTIKKKKQIKKEIVEDLLPRALVAEHFFHYYQWRNWLFVGVTNSKAVKLAKTLYSVRAIDEEAQTFEKEFPTEISATLTDWVKINPTGNFSLGDECLLSIGNDPSTASKAKMTHHDLNTSEVLNHINKGKSVVQLNLVWNNQISFIITDKFQLQKIKFLNKTKDKKGKGKKEELSEYELRQEEITQIRMIGEMIDELVQELGGLR